MKKKRFIPFSWMPAAWGLRGPAYAEAEAAYYYDGEELDRMLAEIRYNEDPDKLIREALRIEHKYGNLDDYEYDCKLARCEHPDETPALELAMLNVKLKHNRVTESEFEKQRATILNEPWVGILQSGYDADRGISGLYFALDWNSKWIERLVEHGYQGRSEQEIIDQWFNDVCRSQGLDAAFANNVVPFGV